ncbi:hypothetical protein U1Q18_012040, partial [Sarracenia purpurea var. burkii]
DRAIHHFCFSGSSSKQYTISVSLVQVASNTSSLFLWFKSQTLGESENQRRVAAAVKD